MSVRNFLENHYCSYEINRKLETYSTHTRNNTLIKSYEGFFREQIL